jgi:hypothetical protein
VLVETNTLLGGFPRRIARPQIAAYYGLILAGRVIFPERRNFLIRAQKRIYWRKKENW